MENCVVGLNRRKFTREFKEAAVRRLELGASMAEVVRACEVTITVSNDVVVSEVEVGCKPNITHAFFSLDSRCRTRRRR